MDKILEKAIERIQNGQVDDNAVGDLLDSYYDVLLNLVDSGQDSLYPKELTLPLVERKTGIYEAMCWLIEKKFDLNAGNENALTVSVRWADAPMTEFLIEHGADANYWPGIGEEDWPWEEDNYYLEDIDIASLGSHFPKDENYVRALTETAKVLVTKGHTGGFDGYGLTVDAEGKKIRV